LVETIYNKLIIITAPSGAGKTSITKYLLNKYPQLSFSVSATTRTQRKHEENGLDYYFISTDDFKQKIQHNEFVEWEMVYQGKYYGTLKTELHRIWDNNQVPVLDIDVKGAIHVRQKLVFNCLSVFIEPPSIEILRKRLEARGTETPETLQDRINKASYEISFKDNFDNVIINDDLDKACRETEFIVQQFLAAD
jgi:guanylate kinase